MSNLKKFLLIFIFSSALIVLGTITSNASGDLYLNNLDFDVKINSDGSMDVVETWDIDIEDTNTLFKTFKRDSSKYSEITDVKVTEIKNGYNNAFTKINKEMYHVTKNCYYGLTNSKGEFEIAWGIGMDTSEGKRKYQISYKVVDAISKNKDHSELYWQFVGENFEVDAKKITGTIKLPSYAANKEDIKVWGHTEDLNGEIYVTSKDKVEFELNDFRHGKYVEVRIAIPTDISIYSGRTSNKTLQDIVDEETVWAEEANKRREFRQMMSNFFALSVIGLSVVAIIFILKNIKKKLDFLGSLEKYQPSQRFQYYRDIPNEQASPGEALMLFNQRSREFYGTEVGALFSAILLDLSLKKYIEFEVIKEANRKDTVVIKLLKYKSSNITTDEQAVFDFLRTACLNKNNQITFKELEKYIKNHSRGVLSLKGKIDKQAKNTLIRNGKIDANGLKKAENNTKSILLYMFGMIYGGIGTLVFSFINLKTLIGLLPLVVLLTIGLIISIKINHKTNVFTRLRS